MKRLLAYRVTQQAIPSGGGLAAAIDFITSGKMADVSREALAWIDEAISVAKTAPDNPYGNDEEAIAGAILAELQKR